MWYVKSANARLVSSVLILFVLSLVARGSESSHIVEKRQVGVLARTGALPQGKRSVEALARNGELPVPTDDKRDNSEDYVLDQLIRELGTAEGLSRLRVQALAERLESERDDEYDEMGKRSVSSLARNSQLPQKRAVTHRSGYLLRPASPESADEETDLLDPDGFLGKTGVGVLDVNGGFNVADGSLASFAKHGYEDNGEEVAYFDDEYEYPGEKRHVGAARNFLSDGKNTVGSRRGYFVYGGRGKRNLASFKNFGKRTVGSALNFGKRNVGAARNFLLSDKRNIGSLKNFISGKRNVGAARNFLLGDSKRNVGAAKNFLVGNKRNLGAAKDFLYGKRNLASFARDGGFTSLKYPSMKDYDWDDFFDFDDFHEDEEKRNLGSFKSFGKRSADIDHGIKPHAESKERKEGMTPKGEERGSNNTRTKREAYLDAPTDEYPMPVLQASGELDYGDVEALADDMDVQKRFLGSVASWPKNQQYLGVTKRHIGALARLGWLPSFRATRYSRSGRAISSRSMAPFRPNPPIGSCQTEDAKPIWSSPPSVETKVALGTRGIFRRVGRSAISRDTILLEPQQNYS